MQSPAGWMCIVLVLVGVVGTPILDNKLTKIRKERYLLISVSKEQENKEEKPKEDNKNKS
jgi:uncharacterized membrane protein affecting hemolysin expression